MIERDTYSDSPELDRYDGSDEAVEAYYSWIMAERAYHCEPEAYLPFDAIDYQDADDVAESYEELLNDLFSSEH